MTSTRHETTGSAASVWDHEAVSYDQSRQADPVYSSCIDMVAREIPKGITLCLDAGAGTGLTTEVLSARCNRVIAVDYSIKSLKILKSKRFDNVIVVQADLTALPFNGFVFDACACANTLQHLKPHVAQESAISELRRVTKENGVLSISVHHYSNGKKKAGWIKEGKPGQSGIDYIFRFTRNDLLALFPRSQIRGVGYYGFLKVPFLGSRVQNLLAILFGRFAALFGYGHMLVTVSKDVRQTQQ